MHLQDDRGEIGALDLGLGERRPRKEVLLRIQADRDTWPDTAAAARALVGRGLRDLLDGQSLQSAAMAVAADAGDAGVDDRTDAGHGERSLGDIGREHDAPASRRLEHALLFLLRETRVQRQHLTTLRMMFAQRFGRLADLTLAAQEHQDVARLLAPQLVDRGENGVLFARRLSRRLPRPAPPAGNALPPDNCGRTH